MENSFISKLFLVILLGAVILVLKLFWTYISAIVLALLIASAFYPLYLWALKRLFKGNERSASLFMSLFILLVLVIPVGGFVGTLSNEAFDFYNRTKDSVSLKRIQEGLEGNETGGEIRYPYCDIY